MTRPQRVLVVDDAELARTTMQSLLRRVGHEVRLAGSVAEARHALAEWAPDCVVLDRRLPDGDGLVLAGQLRTQPDLSGIRIVVMSGDPMPAEGCGVADAFLLKPAGARAVLSAIAGVDET